MEQISEEEKSFLAQLKDLDYRVIHFTVSNMRQTRIFRNRPVREKDILAFITHLRPKCEPDPPKGIDICGVKHFNRKQLEEWTDNFSEKNIFSRGLIGFGNLFRLNNHELSGAVVKKFNLTFPSQGYHKLQPARLHNEVIMPINGITHPNLAKVIGYSCDELLAVVYGDLRPKLHMDVVIKSDFAWKVRMKMAWQLADLLNFMHRKGIAVCSISKENMVIDENDDVKLLSAGLDAHGHYKKASFTTDYFFGSYGCFAPELSAALEVSAAPELFPEVSAAELSPGLLAVKTDIYGYGILLLELISKEMAYSLDPRPYVDAAKKSTRPLVHESFQLSDSTSSILTSLALSCLCEDPELRPKMSQVLISLQELYKDLGNGLSKKVHERQEGAVEEEREVKKMTLEKL